MQLEWCSGRLVCVNEPNPYAASAPVANPTYSQSGFVSEAVVAPLRRTAGWVRFISVLFWIGGIFTVFGAAVALLGSGQSLAAGQSGLAGVNGIGLVVYAGLGLAYLYPALKLWQYGSRCSSLSINPTESLLVDALEKQQSFWRFVGFIILASFALGILMVLGMAAMFSSFALI